MAVRLDPELGFEFGEFGAEGGEFGFDALFPVGVDGGRGWGDDGGDGGDGGGGGVGVDGTAEEVGVSGDAAAVAGGEADDKGAFGVILQGVEFGFDAGEIGEGVQALSALAEFAGGLVTAEEEGAKEGDRGGGEVVDFGVQVVFEFGHAGAGLAELEGPLGFAQAFEGAGDGGFVEAGDGFAIGGLVAGSDEGVEGERIGVRDEDFFFEEAAEDAGLFEGERGHLEAKELGLRFLVCGRGQAREIAGGEIDFELPNEGFRDGRGDVGAGEGDGDLALVTAEAVGDLVAEKLGGGVVDGGDAAEAGDVHFDGVRDDRAEA